MKTLEKERKSSSVIRVTDTDSFVHKSKKTHNDKYCYDKTVYMGSKGKVCITCPVHGDFWQVAESHHRGKGCPSCKGTRTRNALRKSKEYYLTKASTKHNNKYDYSLVDDISSSKDKIFIICPDHGVFVKGVGIHLFGQGCPNCSKTKPRRTLEDVIQECSKVHNNKYTYLSVDGYETLSSYLSITCPDHGTFKQMAKRHVSGAGCPQCALQERGIFSSSYFLKHPEQSNVPTNVYILRMTNSEESFLKVGITKNLKNRIRDIGTDSGYSIDVIAQLTLPAIIAYYVEKGLKNYITKLNIAYNPARSFDGQFECALLDKEDALIGILHSFEHMTGATLQ